ncbi:gamma-butyrobetaine hydroxylase-like domain-containing protein [Cupriavidus sp. SW-Y-13]|uniref:gamma-butyrobetaine hydroxylase-like domain-containing protein n=1 Tax=Cupriavidus sp. SW-Y-13 TaxID=2653854 RepID=UPI0013660981|nr:DUF971 domain-containing protein [Cupriavidus sp. SW-Y-13]MWL86206.1 DUF971 domain-containing protein [Cupriavidus sp. SW-Y-13]
MAGLDKDTPHPTALTVHTQSRVLEVGFDNGRTWRLPFELLRVYSPSAEVKGHGPGQETLQTGKRGVGIAAVEPVGNYAILIRFDDGHDTGIYTWDLLYRLGDDQDALWADYLKRLEAAGANRDTPMAGPGGHGCGHHH